MRTTVDAKKTQRCAEDGMSFEIYSVKLFGEKDSNKETSLFLPVNKTNINPINHARVLNPYRPL